MGKKDKKKNPKKENALLRLMEHLSQINKEMLVVTRSMNVTLQIIGKTVEFVIFIC